MSLQLLHQQITESAQSGSISVLATTYENAQLVAPPELNALLAGAFSIEPDDGLAIETSADKVGPITGNQFVVTGKINVDIAKEKEVTATFGVEDDTDGTFLLSVDLGTGWTFGESFTAMKGKLFSSLPLSNQTYLFADPAVASYSWQGNTVDLDAGLNFAGLLKLQSWLTSVISLLPGFTPQSEYVLVGPMDPALIGVETGNGKKNLYPGFTLRAELGGGSYSLAFLTLNNPAVALTLANLGDEFGLTPFVFLESQLAISDGEPIGFRASIPVNGNVYGFSFFGVNGSVFLSAGQLFELMAGQTWYSVIPSQLVSYLDSFGFKNLTSNISVGDTTTIRSVSCVIGSGRPWTFFGGQFTIEQFDLLWRISSPTTKPRMTGLLSADFTFFPSVFPGQFRVEITSDMVVTGSYVGTVSFTDLIAGITNNAIKLPDTFTLEFSDFTVSIDANGGNYGLGATTTLLFDPFGIGTFGLKDVALDLGAYTDVGETGESDLFVVNGEGATTKYSADIEGSLIIGSIYLDVSISYDDGDWELDARMPEGETIDFQGLIDAVFEALQLPSDIFSVGLQVTSLAATGLIPASSEEAKKYTFEGGFRWQFSIFDQSIDTQANLKLAYDSSKIQQPYTGSVTATTTFSLFGIGATFTVGYEIKNEEGKSEATQTIFLTWEGLTAKYIQGSGQKIVEFSADNTWNLGRLINQLVRLVAPSASKELPAPWNLLNNVSLAGLKIKFNLDETAEDQVTVSWPLKVNLFFGEITSLNIIKKRAGGVDVTLTGSFLFTNTDDVAWDAVNEDPPEVPGGGDSAFDLRLLALGQHVTVPDLASIMTVNDAVNQLKGFEQPAPASRKLPIGPGIPTNGTHQAEGERNLPVLASDDAPPPVFSRDSNWLVGTHFLAVASTLDLKLIFNDPVLYGLRIGLAGPKAKIFAGLEFEIMYKKVTESIGMYKILLKLPDAMRYLQFGSVTIILPVVGVEIYTNGNFKVDFGFPYNMDFSRSLTVQVFPFTGSGGFYFGWLNGATSSQVPKDTPCGNFTPVVEFGLGLQVGLGKSISVGILKAEVAVTVFGILEGVVATWRAYDNSDMMINGSDNKPVLFGSDNRALGASGGDANVETAYYYKVTGTLGIIGKIVGVVDFAIIKAEVNLTVYAYIQGTFEAYRKSLVVMEAGVQVALKFTINCGFFKIKLNLSFSAQIKMSFTIGKDQLESAPWYCDGGTSSTLLAARPGPLMSLEQAVRLYALEPNFAPLQTPEGGVLTLPVFFLPQLSISGEGGEGKSDQNAIYSINLFMSHDEQSQGGETYRSFERFVRDTYLWLASSFSGRSEKGTPDEELVQIASLSQMNAALEYLTTNSDGRSLTYEEISANLAALFQLNIQLPPDTEGMEDEEGSEATAFPMGPELLLKATYKEKTITDVDFTDWSTADDAYLEELQAQINKLIAQMLDELEASEDGQTDLQALLRKEAVGERSLATFVFVDYFSMIGQYLVQGAIDTFENYAYTLLDGDSINGIRGTFNAMGDGNQNHLTDENIAWMNREHPLTPELDLTINNVPYRIQDAETWGGIATDNGLDPGDLASENAEVEQVLIPGIEMTIDGVTKNVPNSGSIVATATEFGTTPEEFGNDIADMEGVLQPLTVIELNGLSYTTADSNDPDTIASLAEHYGIEVAVLTPSIAETNNLFDRSEQKRIILSGLEALTNEQLWNDIRDHSGVAHLSGMAGRYLLSGLRLPVEGITFRDPNHVCAAGKTCGLQNITGQQFSLPSLSGYDASDPMVVMLKNSRDVPWITFTNPSGEDDSSELDFSLPKSAADQVNALLEVATETGLQAPIAPPIAMNLAENRARHYTFRNNIVLQTPTTLPLPNNALPEGTTARPRIWNFPTALLSQLGRNVVLDPRFLIEIGSTNSEGGRLIPRVAQAYGFGTLINVSIKQVVQRTQTGGVVLPTTYELVGADEVGINQLEGLLGAIRPDDTSIINGIYVLYQPNQTSDRAEGLQYDGEENYATFLVQANLSSETNPPTDAILQKALVQDDEELRGLLNNDYQFLSQLWSGSIVRSGGYYFSYELADGNGLPESLFNEDSVANISILVVYNPIEEFSGADGGVLENFMNVAVMDDPIDEANDVVYMKSMPRSAQVTMEENMSLAEIAASYHLGVIGIAESNLEHTLSTTAPVAVTDIVHQVGRGETLSDIENYYNKSQQEIEDANPHVDFDNLTAGTGLHIPDLTTYAKEDSPGITLPKIALYYNTTVGALAWANRHVEGFYTAEEPLEFQDLLLDKEATLPVGNVGLIVSRQNPGDDSEDPSVYLEQQYNLLGYDLISNTDFTAIPDSLPLPSGPTEEESQEQIAQAKLSAPAEASSEAPWNYTFTVPASRAARNNPVPESTADDPYPSREMNPYAGVGGFLQLSLDWRDMMGNHTWSPFDNNSSSNTYPLNNPPSRVGFTDDVIGLGQWPSTQFDHFFRREDDTPQLVIEWSFNPSRYEKEQLSQGEDEVWKQNAQADQQVFASLYYQLVQTYRLLEPENEKTTVEATLFETVTSLDGNDPKLITSDERTAIHNYVLTAWQYITSVLENNGTLPPDSELPESVMLTRDIDPEGMDVITEISVGFQARRPDPTILADFRDDDPSRVNTTTISARLVQTTENGEEAGFTLDWYTQEFQNAFTEQTYQFRLATGTARGDVTSKERSDTLWAVRFGSVVEEAYAYRLNKPAMFFAPAPLSTTLINRPNVSLYSFTPEGGLSATPDITQSYTGVDLDVWARTTLAAFDQLLSSQYAVPAFLVDQKGGTNYLQSILDTKYKLAGAIVEGVTNILCKPQLDPDRNKANFAAAREKLRQQLLIELENAYAIDAVVQYDMDVTAPSTHTDEKTVPRIYGNPVDPNQSTTAKDYTASSFKVPLMNGSSLLTYTFRARDAHRQASFPLKLEYHPTHIEHQIDSVPGIDEYQASSWLNFIDSLEPISLDTDDSTEIDIDIPIPLRAYPTPPSLQNQTFTQDDHENDPTTTLEKAKEWTFRFIYSQIHAAQDRIDSVVQFNVPLASGAKMLAEPPVDLVVMLARINHVLGQIQATFEEDLLQIELNTDTSSTTFVQAQNALSAFATLTNDLDLAWSSWVSVREERARLAVNALNLELPFSILEDAILEEVPTESGAEELEVLRVTVAYPTELLPNIQVPPIVTFEGYLLVEVDPEGVSLLASHGTTEEKDVRLGVRRMLAADNDCEVSDDHISRKAWIYRRIDPKEGELPYLTWDEALEMPGRRVDIRELDAIEYQNAWANVRIIRNANLIGPENPTRTPFIYRTPKIQFRNKLTPLLDTMKEIEVATIPSGLPQQRTMEAHLTELFKTFFKGSPSQEQLVKLEARYDYSLGEEVQMPNIELPMHMIPPTEFQIPNDWQNLREVTTTAGVSAEAFIATLAERLKTWFAAQDPSTVDARFLFDLSTFSSLSNNTQPLVRVRNLVLRVDEVTDL